MKEALNKTKGSKIFLIFGGVVLFLLLIGIASWPLITGHIIRKNIDTVVQLVQKNYSDKLDITISYDKGYLHSNADIEVKLKNDDEPSPALMANLQVDHFNPKGKMKITPNQEFNVKFLNDSSKTTPHLSVNAVFSLFSMQIQNKVTLTPLSLSDAQNNKYNIGNLLLDFLIQFDKKQIKLGNSSFSLSNFSKNNIDHKDTINLNNLLINYNIDRRPETIDSLINIHLDKYTDANVVLSASDLQFKAQNINSKAMTELVAFLSKMLANRSGTSGQLGGLGIIGDLMGLVPKIIKHSPRLEISKLNIITQDGPLSGEAVLDVPSLQDSGKGGGLWFLSILKTIYAKIELKTTEKLVSQLVKLYHKKMKEMEKSSPNNKQLIGKYDSSEEILDNIYTNNYLVKKNDSVMFNFSYKEGRMTLNDTPFSIPKR